MIGKADGRFHVSETPLTYAMLLTVPFYLPDGDTVARAERCPETSLRAHSAPEGPEPAEPRSPPRRRLRPLVLPQLLLLRGPRCVQEGKLLDR